jgi:hypothetical protein
MPLKLRPSGLGHGVYKDNVDYSVFSGDREIGRIYERHGFPDESPVFWLLQGAVLPTAPRRAWRERASLDLRLVSSVRFAETVLNGPAVLASVEGLISPWPIEPTVTSVPAISVTFPSIPFPVPVPGAVVVVAIAGSRVIAEIEIDALR